MKIGDIVVITDKRDPFFGGIGMIIKEINDNTFGDKYYNVQVGKTIVHYICEDRLTLLEDSEPWCIS